MSNSRLCIKNLPKHLTEQRLRQHFEQKGEVTDVKILKTKDGRPRQMGFVGYRTSKEAKEALKYFHNTYIDTSKISVELAKPVGSKDLARPWSKYSKGSSGFDKRNANSSTKQTAKPAAPVQRKREREQDTVATRTLTDPKLGEFMKTLKPSKLWANDDGGIDIGTTHVEKRSNNSTSQQTITSAQLPKEKDREVRVIKKRKLNEFGIAEPTKLVIEKTKVQSKKAGGQGVYYDRTHLKFEDLDEAAAAEETEEGDGEQKETSNNIAEGEVTASHPLGSAASQPQRESKEHEEVQENEEESEEEHSDHADNDGTQKRTEKASEYTGTDEAEPPQEVADEDLIATTGRLFVRNLAYTTTEEDLYKLFRRYGTVSECHIPIDTEARRSRGVAFVEFVSPHDALKAYTELDMTIFQGRLLHVLPAKPRPNAAPVSTADPGAATFKKAREQQRRKAEAHTKHSDAWNPLFLRADTVAMATAAKLGVTKAELLDATAATAAGATPAVRLALGEAAAVDEARRGLELEGIALHTASAGATQRSDTVVLVKNLPYGTREEELRLLFGRHGNIGRVVLLSAGGMSLIEFLNSVDARRAFAALAYKKFKHVPLYLEWAPVGTAAEAFEAAESAASEPQTDTTAPPEAKQQLKAELEAAVEIDAVEAEDALQRTLYVKNINFATTELALRTLFERYGRVLSVTLPKRKNGNAGFGFVELRTREDAVRAIKALQGAVLDGHALVIKFSESPTDAKVRSKLETTKGKRGTADGTVPASTKLLVRNVPFEANVKELRELFGAFGQLKSVRIPKKFNGEGRGYAFVDFLTKQEAAAALEALKHTHLYGRHLVIEYAKE